MHRIRRTATELRSIGPLLAAPGADGRQRQVHLYGRVPGDYVVCEDLKQTPGRNQTHPTRGIKDTADRHAHANARFGRAADCGRGWIRVGWLLVPDRLASGLGRWAATERPTFYRSAARHVWEAVAVACALP